MRTMSNEACWTLEMIAEIEAALGFDRQIGTALSDDDLSHVPTFGTVVDRITMRAAA